MSLTLKCYNYNSKENILNKTLGNPIATYTGNFRSDFNVLYPAFVLDDSANILNNLNFNYVEIDELDRYYYVSDYTRTVTGLIALSLSEDLLMTYQSGILSTGIIINRSNTLYDKKIIDGMDIKQPGRKLTNIPLTSYSSQLALGSGAFRDSKNIIDRDNDSWNDLRIIVRVAGEYLAKSIGSWTVEKFLPLTADQMLVTTPKGLYKIINTFTEDTWAQLFEAGKSFITFSVVPFNIIVPGSAQGRRIAAIRCGFSNLCEIKFYEGDTNPVWTEMAYCLKYDELQGTLRWTYNISSYKEALDYLNRSEYMSFLWDMQPLGQYQLDADILYDYTDVDVKYDYNISKNEGLLYYQGFKTVSGNTIYSDKRILASVSCVQDLDLVYSGSNIKEAITGIAQVVGGVAGLVAGGANAIGGFGSGALAKTTKAAAKESAGAAYANSSQIEEDAKNIASASNEYQRADMEATAKSNMKKFAKSNAAMMPAWQRVVEAQQLAVKPIVTTNVGIAVAASQARGTFASLSPSPTTMMGSNVASLICTDPPYLIMIQVPVKHMNYYEFGRPSLLNALISECAGGFVSANYIYWNTFNPTFPITLTEKQLLAEILENGIIV